MKIRFFFKKNTYFSKNKSKCAGALEFWPKRTRHTAENWHVRVCTSKFIATHSLVICNHTFYCSALHVGGRHCWMCSNEHAMVKNDIKEKERERFSGNFQFICIIHDQRHFFMTKDISSWPRRRPSKDLCRKTGSLYL